MQIDRLVLVESSIISEIMSASRSLSVDNQAASDHVLKTAPTACPQDGLVTKTSAHKLSSHTDCIRKSYDT